MNVFQYIFFILLFITLCVDNVINEENNFNPFRIIGGYSADIDDVPYIVSLILFDVGKSLASRYCGGSIISKYTIITAAHCYYKPKVASTLVRAGSSELRKGGWTRSTTKHIIHEHYNEMTLQNDIALVILDSANPFPFNNNGISKISMEFDNNVIENAITQGRLCLISGWGQTKEVQPSNQYQLLSANVPLINLDSCKKKFDKFFSKQRQLCAGGAKQDSCTGDSGGPLVLDDRLIGITSWGYGCGRQGFPGIYTKISAYKQWIMRHI